MAKRTRTKKLTAREARDLETFEELRALLEEREWSVHQTRHLDGRGGHCVVRGERRVILRRQLPTTDKIELLVEALRGQDEELETVHLRPDLRELLCPGAFDEPAEPPPAPGVGAGAAPAGA